MESVLMLRLLTLDERLIIEAKTRGIKNAMVYP